MKQFENGITNLANTTQTPFVDEALTELPFAHDEAFMNELVMGPDGFLMRRRWLLSEDHDAWSFRK